MSVVATSGCDGCMLRLRGRSRGHKCEVSIDGRSEMNNKIEARQGQQQVAFRKFIMNSIYSPSPSVGSRQYVRKCSTEVRNQNTIY